MAEQPDFGPNTQAFCVKCELYTVGPGALCHF